MTGFLVLAGIVFVCHALGWVIADRSRWTEDQVQAFAAFCAIGVLCAVIW